MKYQKDPKELATELSEQIEALRTSAAAYDNGVRWEAKRLAATLYILLHDGTGRTKSLLGLNNRKAGMKFFSSKFVPPPVIPGSTTVMAQATLLTAVRISNGSPEFAPIFEAGMIFEDPKALSFTSWYDESVFHPLSKITLTRKNLIFSLRTQDGGGHVDDHLTDEQYAYFKAVGDPFLTAVSNGVAFGAPGAITGDPIKNGVWATMRQIAWEVDQSLRTAGL